MWKSYATCNTNWTTDLTRKKQKNPYFFEVAFFFGTLAPSSRASDNPMATACFGFVTFLPLLPLFNCPCFISCMARSTLVPAFFEYLAIKKYFNNYFFSNYLLSIKTLATASKQFGILFTI